MRSNVLGGHDGCAQPGAFAPGTSRGRRSTHHHRSFAVNAHGVIRPSRDLDIVPSPDPANLHRLATLLADIGARHVGLGDLRPDEFPFDPTNPEALLSGANFRVETRLGDLDIMQWIPGIDAEPAYGALESEAITGELNGTPLRVCGLAHLVAMKRAAGTPARSR